MEILLDYGRNLAMGYPIPDTHNEPPVSKKMLMRDGSTVEIRLHTTNANRREQMTVMEVFNEMSAEPLAKSECTCYELMVYDASVNKIHIVRFTHYFGLIKFALGLNDMNEVNISDGIPITEFEQYNSFLFMDHDISTPGGFTYTARRWIKLPTDDYWSVHQDLQLVGEQKRFLKFVSIDKLTTLLARFKINGTFA